MQIIFYNWSGPASDRFIIASCPPGQPVIIEFGANMFVFNFFSSAKMDKIAIFFLRKYYFNESFTLFVAPVGFSLI